MEGFEIILNTWDNTRKIRGKFKFHVECIYQSNQVERYKLTGGTKEMTLEKNLITVSSYYKNWKIRNLNFAMDIVNESTVITLHDIYKKIDEHMTGVKNIHGKERNIKMKVIKFETRFRNHAVPHPETGMSH